MKRKKLAYNVIVVFSLLLLSYCRALTVDDLLLSDPIRQPNRDRSALLADEIVQHLTRPLNVGLEASEGVRHSVPAGIYQNGPVDFEPSSHYEYDEHFDTFRSSKLPYNEGRVAQDDNEPFDIQIDDRINPYELVSIERGQKVHDDEPKTTTKNVAEKSMKKTTVQPSRRGEIEYDTFVNPPSMRKAEQKSQMPFSASVIQTGSNWKKITGSEMGDTVFYAVAGVCSLAAVLGLVFAAVSYTRLRKQYQQNQMNEFPSLGFGGSRKSRSPESVVAMDSKLASAAQLYHFQHTKQQIISVDHPICDAKEAVTDDSEVEEDEGDYSVYECPGLAPTGNMEINNPMFLKTNGKVNGQTTGDESDAAISKPDLGESKNE